MRVTRRLGAVGDTRVVKDVAHVSCNLSALGGPRRCNLNLRIHERAFQQATHIQQPRDAASLRSVHAHDLIVGPLAEDRSIRRNSAAGRTQVQNALSMFATVRAGMVNAPQHIW